jgi:hypothetical protein
MSHRSAWGAAAVALLLTAFQDPGRQSGGEKMPKCDLKTLEKGVWCRDCNQLLGKAEFEKKEKVFTHKDQPDHKCLEVDVCVKTFYRSSCHPDKQGPKQGTC